MRIPGLLRAGVFLLFGSLFGWLLSNPQVPPGAQNLIGLQNDLGEQFELPKNGVLRFAKPATAHGNLMLRTTYVIDAIAPVPTAIWLGYVNQPVELIVNGARMEKLRLLPGADDAGLRQSYLFFLPPELLHAGGNSVEMYFRSPNNSATLFSPALHKGLVLGDLWVGPRDALEAHFYQHYRIRVTLTEVAALCAAIVAAFAAMLWISRRKEAIYGWFALGVALWLVYLWHFVWYQAPFVGASWIAGITIALAFSLLAIRRFVNCFLQQQISSPPTHQVQVRRSSVDRGIDGLVILAVTALVSVSALAQQSVLIEFFMRVLMPLVLLVQSLRICWLLLAHAKAVRRDDAYWLASAALLGLACAVLDTGTRQGWRTELALPILQLAILPIVVVFGYSLLQRFLYLLGAIEAENALLDRRILEKSSALEEQFQARRQLEKEKLLSEERHRLATDLHDGAGSQLVSLLAAVRHSGMSSQQMEQALIEAIADLRLVMDSIDSFGADLAEALGQFRSRLEPRLKAAGLHSIWRTANLPEGLKLSPRRMLNIFRALQEALVNVIKHAKASEVQISAREAGSALEFIVQDNGVGIADLPEKGSTPRGRGRLNLEQRMKALGGYARFQAASPNGLAVHLLVPIPNANETNL
jgi:signal transduction histidine kinase